jgi:hypothetical protein
MGDWTFFSNYGHVLVCLAKNQDTRLRDVAAEVGITERAVQKIVHDLQQAGFLEVSKHGRRNRYKINRRKALRHDLESHCTVGKLLALILKSAEPKAEAAEQDEKVESPPPPVVKPKTKKPPADRPAEPAVANKPVDTRQQGSLF